MMVQKCNIRNSYVYLLLTMSFCTLLFVQFLRNDMYSSYENSSKNIYMVKTSLLNNVASLQMILYECCSYKKNFKQTLFVIN